MTAMSKIEAGFCRSAPWRGFARRVVLPWALDDQAVHGRTLEIGCGSGAMAQALLARSAAPSLFAIDMDPRMASAARRRLERAGHGAVVGVADATRLPFASESFDVVVSWLMLHHTIEWEAAIAETRRVLRPGGRFVGYDLLQSFPARLIHRLDRSPHRLFTKHDLERTLDANYADLRIGPKLGGLICRFDGTRRELQPTAEPRSSDDPRLTRS